jgi:uncharacterized protein YdhG (YjbR/CyaY superfamily)
MATNKPASIDEYISGFPEAVQCLLQQVRDAIRMEAPQATEVISYGIPTFNLNGPLVHFAAFKSHIGFYATPTGHEAFIAELSAYKQGKGSVQFPFDRPLPIDLIKRIVKFRIDEKLKQESTKK